MRVVHDNNYLDLEGIQTVRSDNQLAIASIRGTSGAIEKFSLLAHRLQRARSSKTIRTVLVTSSIPAEGKSTIALNLAVTFASKEARTLLIDADLRVPTLAKMLSCPPLPGLGPVLRGESDFENAVRRVDPLGLYFLPAGERTQNPLPLLEGPVFADILTRARKAFEWVIIDSTPLNLLADAQCIAALVDAIVLIVRWDFTPKEELTNALNSLKGLPLLGVVVNRFDEAHDAYYSYYVSSEAEAAPPSAGDALEDGKK